VNRRGDRVSPAIHPDTRRFISLHDADALHPVAIERKRPEAFMPSNEGIIQEGLVGYETTRMGASFQKKDIFVRAF
jgi:hypothetical protein